MIWFIAQNNPFVPDGKDHKACGRDKEGPDLWNEGEQMNENSMDPFGQKEEEMSITLQMRHL